MRGRRWLFRVGLACGAGCLLASCGVSGNRAEVLEASGITTTTTVATTTIATTTTTGRTTTTLVPPNSDLDGTYTAAASIPHRLRCAPEVGVCKNLDNPYCVSGVGTDVGTGVTVYDESGEIIGAGRVESVRWINLAEDVLLEASPALNGPEIRATSGDCLYEFSVDDVGVANFYEVEIGSGRPISYSAAELEDLDWFIEIND